MMRTRLAAGAAALLVAGGAGTMLVALVAAPGSWWQGYVSEAGTAGQPYAVAYRWGVLALALGVALLGWAVRPVSRGPADPVEHEPADPVEHEPADPVEHEPADPVEHEPADPVEHEPADPVERGPAGLLVAGCLVVAAVLAGMSGLVPCSNRCPLPPYEPATAADVVHGAASVLGVVVLFGAMAATWLTDPRPATRRLAAGAVVLTVPLGGAMGLTMLLAGRGTLGAVLERVLLAVAVTWVLGTALLAATGPRNLSGGP
jgi:hypothetical protein